MIDPHETDSQRRAGPDASAAQPGPAADSAVDSAAGTAAKEPGPEKSAWETWLASPPGQYVMRWETEQLSHSVVDVFGYYALQLGFLELDALAANRMPHRIRVSKEASDLQDPLLKLDLFVGGFEELPLESQSVDLVVLAHQLEFSDDPHQVLREVDRVLRPEGRLVVVGMNPLSLWGLRQSIVLRPLVPFLPPTSQFIGVPRLRDWMKLLSFEIDSGQYGCYVPPCRTQKWLDRTQFMEKAGDRWWPICGAVYMVSAVKRVRGMRLVGPVWKRRPAPKAAPAVAVSGRTIGSRAVSGPAAVSDRTYSRESGVILPFRRRS